jgi:hypothetical protein
MEHRAERRAQSVILKGQWVEFGFQVSEKTDDREQKKEEQSWNSESGNEQRQLMG